uniref:Uncharacterized protein n=1 Tax=Panagrolaimus sp. PS1159 TaxID=55785 RepID=A0AC35GG76_9BILA
MTKKRTSTKKLICRFLLLIYGIPFAFQLLKKSPRQ